MITRSLKHITSLIIALHIFAIGSTYAQTTQAGRIVEYNGEDSKTPIAGVEIDIKNAATTVSDADGRFILEFKTMRPGQHVNVNSILKDGYEIFHLDAIEQWNINPDVPFTIVMVNSARFKERCEKFFSTSSHSYRAQHEADLRALETEREEGRLTAERYEQEREALIASYESQLENLTAYINRFARIDLENLSLIEREIISAIENGDIDKAIEMYDNQKLVQTYLTQVEQRNQMLEAMTTNINETYQAIRREILANMIAGGKERFDKITEYYELMLAADPTNTMVAGDYVEFLVQQGNYERTIAIGNTILQGNPNDYLYTTVCHDIACAYIYTHNYDEARTYAMRGLTRCSTEEPMYYTLQHDLSEIYLALGEMDKVRATAQIILNSEYAEPIAISGAANTLGTLEFECGRYEEAIAAYRVLFENADNIAKSGYDMIDKIESLHSLFVAYSNIASCYTNIGNFNAAEDSYEQATLICNDLYAYNPEKYTAAMYSLHNSRGFMYNFYGDNVKALEYIAIASDHITILYQQSPEAYGYFYYQNLNNLGYLSYMEGRYTESELYYDRAYEFINEAYLASPTADIKTEYARLCINYASLYNDMGKYDKAIEKSAVAIEFMDELATIYGEGARFEHSLAHRAFITANHYKGNKKVVKEAIKRFEAFYGESAELLNIQGEIALISGNEKKAKVLYDKTIALDPTFYTRMPSPLNDKFANQ